MDKHSVLSEIKGFLEGYNNDIKYLVNVETDPSTNYAECVIHEPNHEPRIEKIKYEPFMYMKDLSRVGRSLYSNKDESYIESKRIKYGIKITKLKTGNQQRLLDGYCYKLTSHRSFNDIINYIRDGGIDIFEKLTDDFGNFVRDDKGKFIYRNRELFHSVKTTEQFFISTQSRLYKGYEQYKEVHRLTYDIETTGLRYQIARMFAIGVRDNRGFETILEVDKRDDDEAEIRLIQDFFNLLDYIRPAVIVGHNSEEFDIDFILGRAKILKMDLSKLPNGLKEGISLRRKGNTSVKYGNTSDKYTATEMWGYTLIDTLHAAKRTAAVNSDLKRTNLKYIAKYENFARKNRTYIKGEDNDIGRFYNENNVFLINEKNEYIELPDEYQEVGKNLYKLQANKDRISPEQYNEYKIKFLNEDKLKNKKTFVEWYKNNCIEKNLSIFIGGRKLVHQYLLDDLWETEQVDELYNQSSFMLAKIVPTVYQRICTMGTASIWNLLLTTWSYENDLAIPIPDKFEQFGGGLARTYKKGYSKRIIKIDYASLYPMIQLTHGVFPMFDITGVMKKMLLYMTTTRNIYKKMAAGDKLDTEEIGLLKQLDNEAYNKYINNALTAEDLAMFKVKQLPIKILNNSLYGALGSHISFNWSDNICAAWITSVARLELRHAIYWFSKFGCVALLAVTDGINFQIPEYTHIRVNNNGIDDSPKDEAPIDEMWVYGGKTGINALIEYFNDTEMIKPYMSVDNDGESISCFNLARINYATLSEKKDKKTGEIKEKIKLTGNTLKSKVMPEYIEDFIDKGLDLILHGKGKEFVDYYYNYAEDIRYMQIPLKKIASKSKVKQTLKSYKNRGSNKNGDDKASQAHMELLIKQREDIAKELFEKHKLELGFDNPEKEPKKIDDIIKAVINYMPPEPEIDSTVYYVNTGTKKSHGDVKKDKESGEITLNCKLINSKDLEDNPDMKGEYNYERYLDAFNKRVCYSDKKIGALLSAFDPETAIKIPVELIKKGKNAGDLNKGSFNPLKNELELKSFDLDDFDESMYLEEKEVAFWNKTGYDPRLVWDGFKMHDNDKIYFEIYENALNFLNTELEEKGDNRRVKSINDKYEKNDMVLIKNGSEYHVGVYNGIYMQIIRNNVNIPKTEIELELDKINEEKQRKIQELETSELTTKSDREIFLEAQSKKREQYFRDFKQTFNLDLTYTMDKLFSDVPEARGAFEIYIQKAEDAIDESVNEYLDIDDGSY